VLAATAELITEAGIGRVRLAEIARRAGMSSGQVMHYFTSKEHILLATLAWYEDKSTAQRRAALQAATGFWRRLERYVDLYLPSDPADLAWILGTDALARVPHDQDVSDFLHRLWLSWNEDLVAIVHDGVKDGTVGHQVSPEDFAIGFDALLDGLGLHLRHRHGMARERLIELAMNNARAQLAPRHLSATDSHRSQHSSSMDLGPRRGEARWAALSWRARGRTLSATGPDSHRSLVFRLSEDTTLFSAGGSGWLLLGAAVVGRREVFSGAKALQGVVRRYAGPGDVDIAVEPRWLALAEPVGDGEARS
jgi:AcrR family transcriptional regulator